MKNNRILHVLAADTFTTSFVNFVNKEFDFNRHIFLFVLKPQENPLSSNSNVRYLHSRFRKNIIKNTWIFYKSIRQSSKIIIHGNPNLFYFMFFPFILKKTYWIIYGYEIADYSLTQNKIELFIKRFVLKRVNGHITHIKGDSELANYLYGSSAKFYYSPIYLTNVVSDYKPKKGLQNIKSEVKKILIGNSTSPTNNHSSIFKMLLPYKDENIVIYCPLSYGAYDNYRDEVIRNGKEIFGEKFVPLISFMKLEEYKSFLEEIDIAIFNHSSQEAMGVTLTLLSLGKVVYMNSHTTSYNSFISRGFKVFDNVLIENKELFVKRDVSTNPALIYNDYSYEKLISSLAEIFNG